MLNQRRLVLEWLALLLGAAALAVIAGRGGLTGRLDAALLDFSAALAQREPAPDIAIVAIDQRSLAAIGEWPWRRSTHARLIDNLHATGARVVLYDVLFAEPGEAADDAALAAAIARHGKVVLPFSFIPAINRPDGLQPEYPLPALARAAAALGHVEAMPDSDGALRRFARQIAVDGRTYPHFVTAALGLSGAALPAASLTPIVPFHPANSYPAIPAFAVIEGSVPAGLLQGRVVLVGATAQGMGDTHSVPSPGIAPMSGVETQANLFDALRAGTVLREASRHAPVMLALAALLIQFAGFWQLSARAGLLLSAALVLASCALAIALAALGRVWLAPGTAMLVVTLAYPLWSWRRLTIVSDYLDHEARRLADATGPATAARGFDMVARQVEQLRLLIGEVSDTLAFVRSAIEASPDAIIVTGADNRVLLVNQAATRLFAATPDPVGMSLAELYLNQRLVVDRESAEITLADGRVFLFASAPLADARRAREAARIMAFRDISQLRRRQREHDELIAFLSHDMRSPQVAIMALTLAIEEAHSDIAARIRNQAELTLGLADGFVQLARVGEVGAQFEIHDLALLLNEAMDQAHALAARKSIALERRIPEDMVLAAIDRSQIARMAANLIGNAIKFTPAGGIVSVALALSDHGDTARITVSDTGPGLPPERLNDPFSRFGMRAGGEMPGAGLGLAFVKRVVDAHHGHITARPRDTIVNGRGTVFEIILPLAQSAPD